MKSWIIAAIGIVLVLGGLSCGSDTNEETKTATITGYVYLSDTVPAPGIHVYDKISPSYSGYTDKDGLFRISVPAGARTIVIDGGIFRDEIQVSLSEGEIKELYPSSSPLVLINNTHYKIAVMRGEFDAIQIIFEQLGIKRISSPDDSANGYVLYDDGSFPGDIETLRKFNLLAFNCGSLTPSISSSVLKEYVQQGGNIYASDWQYWVLDSLGLLNNKVFLHDGYRVGADGTVKAWITDDILKSQIGKDSVVVVFDPGWVIIDSVRSDVKTMLRANVFTMDSVRVENVPLTILIKPFNTGGTLFYTSFHYEEQATSEDVIKMLQMFLVRIGQN